jgi:hypothetical protein
MHDVDKLEEFSDGRLRTRTQRGIFKLEILCV